VCADEIVLIDWAFVGVGVLGEDIGTLIFDAVFDFFVSPEDFPALADLLTDGYRAGLQAAGWTGEFELVLGAIRSSAAVKFFWILPSMLNAAAHGRSTLNRRPIAQTFASWAPVLPRLVEYAHLVT
jgi:hypothetical protein